jgi:hypothetical protein
MVVDALLAADPFLKIAGRIRDPSKFVHLTDAIMLQIESSDEPVRFLFVFYPRLPYIDVVLLSYVKPL